MGVERPVDPDLGSPAMILAFLRTSWGQFLQHAGRMRVDVRLDLVSLAALRGTAKGPKVAAPELMELLLHTLLQNQFDRFPP